MLKDTTVKSLKSMERPYKMGDSGGLYIYVQPNGSKYWRYKYRFAKREKVLSLGKYPSVSLLEAREKRDQAKKLLSNRSDPSELKKRLRSNIEGLFGNTFEIITLEWMQNKQNSWTNGHYMSIKRILEVNVFPQIGSRPLSNITAPELLTMIRKVEERGALTLTRKILASCGQIFRYAIATGRAERNPCPDLKGALISQPNNSHYKHLADQDLKLFLDQLDSSSLHLQVKLAIKLLQLTFVRTNELTLAKWGEINFEKGEWRIPASRMKKGEQLLVPLSKQSIEVLKSLKEISRSKEFIFPALKNPSKAMTSKLILKGIYALGFKSKTTAHGLRASASTILNENGFRVEVIEYQLAHTERNKVRAAYNHAQYLSERKEMMNWWGNYLEGIKGKPIA